MHWKEARETILKKVIEQERVGLVTDMDGTISYIKEHPDDAVVTDEICSLLKSLNQKLTLVGVISGRSVKNLTERISLPGVTYIGNHGLERCVDGEVKENFDSEKYLPMLAFSAKELEKIKLEGVRVEDKGVTLTLHYRQTKDPEAARDLLLPRVKEIAAQTELEFFEGRMIFELRPPVKADKGHAFEQLVQEFELDSALYVGDDTTDIAALEVAQKLRREKQVYAIGVGVMSHDNPNELPIQADLLASGVPDVERLFHWLNDQIE